MSYNFVPEIIHKVTHSKICTRIASLRVSLSNITIVGETPMAMQEQSAVLSLNYNSIRSSAREAICMGIYLRVQQAYIC
jgi:hypothetical protein